VEDKEISTLTKIELPLSNGTRKELELLLRLMLSIAKIKKLTCEELPEYEKKQELGAFLFSSDKDKI